MQSDGAAGMPAASGKRISAARQLRAAASEDEDLNVRWAARYALRLASRFGR
jgi:hypothetical protein